MIFGFGLGYHVQEIASMYPDLEVYVLENDIEQIRTAINYRNITDIFSNCNIHIIYCDEVLRYDQCLQGISKKYNVNKIDCKMWMPSIKAIENNELKELLE